MTEQAESDNEDLNTPQGIIADFLAHSLLPLHRETDAVALIKRGNVFNLRLHERRAVEWLSKNWSSEDINMWTANAVRRYRNPPADERNAR